jgi:hypothetical protein
MNPFKSRQIALVFVAFSVGAVSLLAPEPALADKALFRMKQIFLGVPFPPKSPTVGGVPTSHAAGVGEFSLQPYKPHDGGINSNGVVLPPGTMATEDPAVATVVPGNPIGAKFTLPRSFTRYTSTNARYASTSFAGYTSKSTVVRYNGQGRFRPNNPNGAAAATTVTIHDRYPVQTGMTTMGATSMFYTTTHGGRFDFSRNGYMKIEPNTNHFGGTMRFLVEHPSAFYQYIYIADPLLFKGYGTFTCTRMGVQCTEGLDTKLGEATSSGMVSRFLLTTSNAPYLWSTRNKETASGSPFTSMVYRQKIASPPAISKNYYLHLNAPFTTGKVSAYNKVGVTSGYAVHPVHKGYDKTLSGADLKITRTVTTYTYLGGGKGKTNYHTRKYYTNLTGVTRVVSLVKPRLTHIYQVPRLLTDPIFSSWQANGVQIMKVFFLPEPAGVLMLGAGITVLLGLSRIR